MPYPEIIERVRALGITNDQIVLVYSSEPQSNPLAGPLVVTRFIWALRHCGFENVNLIDGGIQMWEHKGLPLASKWSSRNANRFFTTRPLPVNVAVNSSTEDVKAIVFNDNEDS